MEETQLQTMEEKRPGYKKTKMGWIPEDWEIKKISDLFYLQGGFAFKSELMSDLRKKYQVVKMSNFYQGKLNLARKPSYIQDISKKEEKYLLKAKDIVLTLTGTIGKKDYGFSAKIENNTNLLLNQRLCKLVPKEDMIDELFALYLLKSSRFLYTFFQAGKGGTGTQANVGMDDLKNIEIALPPLVQQREIGKAMESFDKLVEIINRLIINKKQINNGLMQQLLTGKKRLPGFSGEWKEYSYLELLKEVKRDFDWDDNAEYDLISVRRRSGGLFHRESLYGHEIKTKKLRTANAGDFLISKMQIVHGASGLTTEEFDGMKISGSYIAVNSRDKDVLDINFLNWYSKSPEFYHQCYISSYGVHIEKMTFDFKLFLKEKLRIPGLVEQKTISKVLEASQKEIELLKQKKEMLQHQKKGLMQQLLTGKKRITT